MKTPTVDTDIPVQVLLEDASHDLHVVCLAGHAGLWRPIGRRRVQKPGLALAGYPDSVRPHAVQVIGQTEVNYLLSLAPADRGVAVDTLFATQLACVVVSSGLEPPEPLRSAAQVRAVPVLATPLDSETFINRVHDFLDEHLSPEVTLHGVMVDVFGVGALLQGQSGIGKSECALDLILRGHRLVADDVVVIQQRGIELIATGSPVTRHHMEVRGLGIINVRDLFGAAAVREQKRVELVVELVEWQTDTAYDRTGLDEHRQAILSVQVPLIRLPIRPGRNMASIIEVAARNHLLKAQGLNPARALQEQVNAHLSPTDKRLA